MKAIYPGNFDPITYGHIDLIKRAVKIFDEVIVAVAWNSSKSTLFTPEERMDMVKRSIKNFKNVKVEIFKGLVTDYAIKKKIPVLLRGLRMISDFEYEFQMALTNRKLNSRVETVFMMPNEAYSYVSSRLIKEAGSLGANLKGFVPAHVAAELKKKGFVLWKQ
ncbi:MAG: pantetheine-phosphate adenylyltransferase [Candidatus Omnitrophica bacterium]|nr:pantetheine-phosphate adenylyltransferase [Candidatus Omnitrophota bacterium]